MILQQKLIKNGTYFRHKTRRQQAIAFYALSTIISLTAFLLTMFATAAIISALTS